MKSTTRSSSNRNLYLRVSAGSQNGSLPCVDSPTARWTYSCGNQSFLSRGSGLAIPIWQGRGLDRELGGRQLDFCLQHAGAHLRKYEVCGQRH